jgi:hypothetical protein
MQVTIVNFVPRTGTLLKLVILLDKAADEIWKSFGTALIEGLQCSQLLRIIFLAGASTEDVSRNMYVLRDMFDAVGSQWWGGSLDPRGQGRPSRALRLALNYMIDWSTMEFISEYRLAQMGTDDRYRILWGLNQEFSSSLRQIFRGSMDMSREHYRTESHSARFPKLWLRQIVVDFNYNHLGYN